MIKVSKMEYQVFTNWNLLVLIMNKSACSWKNNHKLKQRTGATVMNEVITNKLASVPRFTCRIAQLHVIDTNVMLSQWGNENI